jgi:hypothetical protein
MWTGNFFFCELIEGIEPRGDVRVTDNVKIYMQRIPFQETRDVLINKDHHSRSNTSRAHSCAWIWKGNIVGW